jgi:hypothetical protein
MSDTPLRHALQNLPTYEPPASVWNGLTARLEEAPLATALQRLPRYEPSGFIWQNLETELRRISDRRAWYRQPAWRAAMAAGFAVVLAAIVFLSRAGSTEERVVVSFTEEPAVEASPEVVADGPFAPDASALELVTAYCAEQVVACSTPEFKALKSQFDELDEACASLREALESYGDDPQLQQQLGELERERADVLKTLVSLTLS